MELAKFSLILRCVIEYYRWISHLP